MLKTLLLGMLLLVALPLGLIALVLLPLFLIGALVKLLVAVVVLPFRLLAAAIGALAGLLGLLAKGFPALRRASGDRPLRRRGAGFRADSAGTAGPRGLGRGQVPDSGLGAGSVAGAANLSRVIRAQRPADVGPPPVVEDPSILEAYLEDASGAPPGQRSRPRAAGERAGGGGVPEDGPRARGSVGPPASRTLFADRWSDSARGMRGVVSSG